MRILMIGSAEVWSIEKHFARHLSNIYGNAIELFPIQSMFYRYYYHSVFNRLLYRTGLSRILVRLNKELVIKIEEFKPDVVWVFKGMEVLPETLRLVREMGALLVNYNPDNPLIFSGYGSGNKNVSDTIEMYDLYFTYDRSTSQQLEAKYGVLTKILPFAYELGDDVFERVVTEDELCKACFVGNADKYRIDFLRRFSNKVPLDLYGKGWSVLNELPNVTVHDAVYGEEYWKVIRRYRLQLNLMRPHNPTSHNMRSFEVPAVGGIGLFPDTYDHAYYFSEGKEVFLYKDVDEAVKVAVEILSLTKSDAEVIRDRARARSVESGYSYFSRSQRVQGIFQTLLEARKDG